MLDQRKKNLLKTLIQNENFLTISEISTLFSIGKRTVRYDLDAIDHWLKDQGFEPVMRIPRKGIKIQLHEHEKKLLTQLLEINDYSRYILTPEERVRLIILTILNQTQAVSASMLAEKLSVSKATITNDLKQLESFLLPYRLELKRQPRHLLIVGQEKDRRKVLSDLLKQTAQNQRYLPIKQSLRSSLATMKHWFPKIDLDFLQNLIFHAQSQMEVEFSFESTVNLIVHLSLAIQRLQKGMDIQIQKNQLVHLKDQTEFQLAEEISRALNQKFQLRIPEAETAYITYHLMGAKLNRVKSYETYQERHMNMIPLLDLVIDRVEHELEITIDSRETLQKGLFLHLVPAIQRLQFGTAMKNPLYSKIVSEYEMLFHVCKDALRVIEDNLKIHFDDHEVSYITMHFAASLHRQRMDRHQQQKVLLICASGIGTSRLLKARLLDHFTDFEVLDSLSLQELDSYLESNAVDLIVTTIPLAKTIVPIVEVSPMLTPIELKSLAKYLRPSAKSTVYVSSPDRMASELVSLIQNHAKIINQENLKQALAAYLQNHLQGTPLSENGIFTIDHIQLQETCESWQDAIRLAGAPLVSKKWIDPLYIEQVIQDFPQHPNSTMIAPEIAMPHAKSSGLVKRSGITILTLKEGVRFLNHCPPVRILIFLAASDQEKHVAPLTQIINQLCYSENIAALKLSSQAHEAYEIFYGKEVKL